MTIQVSKKAKPFGAKLLKEYNSSAFVERSKSLS
jgi:hypothetical protein